MALERRIYGPGDAWPFRFMEVGDVVVCTRPMAAQTAHGYGRNMGRKFLTATKRVEGPDGTELVATRVKRMPDDWVKPRAAARAPRGRAAATYPWGTLPEGQTWRSRAFPAGDEAGAVDRERIARKVAAANAVATAALRRVRVEQGASAAQAGRLRVSPFKWGTRRGDGRVWVEVSRVPAVVQAA
jgi:hypothetical protein